MADIGTFPTIRNVLVSGDNIKSYTATEAVKAGQVVGHAATGVSEAVVPMDKTSGETAVGVALYDAAAGAQVAVAGPGCEAYVANADSSNNIDAGTWLGQDDNTVKGTVSAGVAANDRIGIARSNSAGGDTFIMLVQPVAYIAAT